MRSWAPVLQGREGPKYLAIADAIAADVAAGRLAPGDRLPPQRDLAGRLALDFTTVARGYVEAGKRGLVESVVGRGTFVRRHASVRGDAGPQRSRADFTMNMPPEPDDPELLQRMREGFASVAADLELVAPLPGLRRIADGPRCGRELARTARARSLAGAHIPRARRAWRDGRHLQLAGACRGHRALRGDHLSRRALYLCAARFAADRNRHGRRRNHPGGARGGHAPARTESDLSEPHFTKSNDDHDPGTATRRDLLARTPFPDPDRRGRRLWIHPNAWSPAPRRHRARHLLAHCGPCQMHRGWPASGLRRRAGRPGRVVLQQRDARALRDGVADLGGGRDTLDQRRHGRHHPATSSGRKASPESALPRGPWSRGRTSPIR